MYNLKFSNLQLPFPPPPSLFFSLSWEDPSKFHCGWQVHLPSGQNWGTRKISMPEFIKTGSKSPGTHRQGRFLTTLEIAAFSPEAFLLLGGSREGEVCRSEKEGGERPLWPGFMTRSVALQGASAFSSSASSIGYFFPPEIWSRWFIWHSCIGRRTALSDAVAGFDLYVLTWGTGGERMQLIPRVLQWKIGGSWSSEPGATLGWALQRGLGKRDPLFLKSVI